jgi:hypothetical protein
MNSRCYANKNYTSKTGSKQGLYCTRNATGGNAYLKSLVLYINTLGCTTTQTYKTICEQFDIEGYCKEIKPTPKSPKNILKERVRFAKRYKNYKTFDNNKYIMQSRLGQMIKKCKKNLIQHEPIVDLCECIALFEREIRRCNDVTETLQAVAKLYKMVFKKGSIFVSIMKNETITTYVDKLFSDEQQSLEDWIKKARTNFDKVDEFKKSAFFLRIYKLCNFMLVFGFLEKFGISLDSKLYSKYEAKLLKKEFCNKGDFVHAVIESLIYFAEVGYSMLSTGSFSGIVHSGECYKEWYDKAQLCITRSKFLANPEANGFNEFSFRKDVDECILQGKDMLKIMKRDKRNGVDYVDKVLTQLLMIEMDLKSKAGARERRDEPFALLINGPSGIGKSTIKEMLRIYYAKVRGLDPDPSYCYTRNPAAEFWDGFSSDMHTIILDDVAFLNPNAAPGGDPSCMEFLQVVNCVPFVPNQASLEDKGRTPMKAELVIATTNTKHLNAHFYFSCVSANQRRLKFVITAKVKEAYKKNGILNLNHTDESFPDAWEWHVECVEPADKNEHQGRYVTILKTNSVDVLLDWYTTAILEHREKLERIKTCNLRMTNTRMCDKCRRLEHRCTCIIRKIFNVWKSVICRTCGKRTCICEQQSLREQVCKVKDFLTLWAFYTILFKIISEGIIFFLNYTYNAVYRYIVNLTLILSRMYIRRVLARAGNAIDKRTFPIAVVTVLTTIVMYKYYKRETYFQQVEVKETGKRPKKLPQERKDVWYNDKPILTPFNLSPPTLSSKGWNRVDFEKFVANQLIYATLYFDEDTDNVYTSRTTILCLKGNLYLINYHSISKMFEKDLSTIQMDLLSEPKNRGVTANCTIQLSKGNVIPFPNQDYALLMISNIPPRQGVYKYLMRDSHVQDPRGFYVHIDQSGHKTINNVRNISRMKKVDENSKNTFEIWSGQADTMTQYGHCGSPLFLDTPQGYAFAGIHAYGGITNGVASLLISRDMVEQHLDWIPNPTEMFPQSDLVELHPKSTFRYIESGSANVYGSVKNAFVNTGKSRVARTPIADELEKHGYTQKFFAPKLGGWEPFNIAAQDLVKPITLFNEGILAECASAYINDIKNSGVDLSILEVYDLETAVNGAPGVAHVNKIPRNTSAGFPFNRSKQHFLVAVPAFDDFQDPVEITPDMMSRIENLNKMYSSGNSAGIVFNNCLKDEPVSKSKLESGKVRLFSSAPMDWTVLMRMYYLSFVRLVQNNRFIFESGPGTIAQSIEWNELHDHITQYGCDRMIAGDYKAFDKTMSPVFMKYAFEIIIRLCLDSGNFTYEDSKYMRAMYVDIIYPLSIYKGDLVRFFGSNPSGHPLTVIINGLVNSLYIRYVYRLCNPNHTVSDFKDNVCLMTYGDDNIMSVNKNITWFNHTIISKTLNTMGITYTMADKVSESKPFIDIEDCTFLKRSWRWDTDLKAYVGPLDHESIEKMLMVHVRSKTVHPEEQTIDGVSSALREYFFYGKSVYNDKLELLKKVVEKSGLNPFVKRTTFVAWEVLRDKFVENSNIYDYIYEERPLINIDENEYRLQSDHSIIPMDIHRKILLMELPSRKVNDQYIYQSCYLGEYYKASWMLGMNLVHYNRHVYMSNMIGNNTFFPEGEFLDLNQWRSIHYPRPHVESIPWFTKICYFIWIALIIMWYGIILTFIMLCSNQFFRFQ